jgi:hypothetical protein
VAIGSDVPPELAELAGTIGTTEALPDVPPQDFGQETKVTILDAGAMRTVVDIRRHLNPDGTWGDGFYVLGEGFTAEDALREIAKHWPWKMLMPDGDRLALGTFSP